MLGWVHFLRVHESYYCTSYVDVNENCLCYHSSGSSRSSKGWQEKTLQNHEQGCSLLGGGGGT